MAGGPVGVAVQVKMSNMALALQNAAVGFITDALEHGKVEKDMATEIKRNMDATEEGGTWHCIVGQDFGCSLCFENKFLLFVKANEKHVLLFRSYDHI